MPSTHAKAWFTRQDGLDNMYLAKVPEPAPKTMKNSNALAEGEVLVGVRAVSLNYRDTEVIAGQYKHHKTIDDEAASSDDGIPRSLVPCSDMCGVVLAVGPAPAAERPAGAPPVPEWKPGDRVLSTFSQSHMSGQVRARDMATGLGYPLDGVLGSHRVFPAHGLVPAPGYLTDEEAACLPIAWVTAWMGLGLGQHPGAGDKGKANEDQEEPGRLNGKTVVLQGTGGVSIAGLLLAKAEGANTIITSSSDEKLMRASELGATHTINYKTTPDWDVEVMRLTSEHGADVILECGGASTLERSLECIAFGGLISCIGYLGGKTHEAGDGKPRPNINLLVMRRNVTLKGIINGPRDSFIDMCAALEKWELRPVVDRVFGLPDAKDALAYLQAGSHFGKVVIRVGGAEISWDAGDCLGWLGSPGVEEKVPMFSL